MTTGKSIYKKPGLGNLQCEATILWLYLLGLLSGRRLKLSFLSKPAALIFSGSSFTLCWQVSGCYKITVNDTIILPGTSSFIRLSATQLPNPLRLCFYGSSQTIKKLYSIQPIDLQTKQLSHIALQEPELYITQPGLHLAQPEKSGKLFLSSRAFKVLLPSPVFSATLRFRTEWRPELIRGSKLHMQLEPCELPQYNP